MSHGLRFTLKPDAFCITIISWEDEGKAPIPITEVYHGPEEQSSVGPFLHCNYRWELYGGYDSHQLFVWTYKTRDGYEGEEHDSFAIYLGVNRGQSWQEVFRSNPGALLGKKK
jgi:hypothetical protein